MYKIYADSTLVYDSTLEDYKISKGEITKEVGKSGSFVFSLYPDHPFYDSFVALKTVITVYKSGRIVFRGRVLDERVDYWNNKELTCEGELGFLQDSVVRPFTFQGTPANLLKKLINDHNAQVDSFKKFKLGTVDIQDGNDYINRSATGYGPTQDVLNSALTGSALGGYIYITHGDDGTDQTPTINYVKDFSKVASQSIEFGSNLKDYVKTTDAAEIATALIPLGAETGGDTGHLTIADVNGGKDYIYHEAGVALRGWVFKTVVWDDVTLASNLKEKAEAYLESAVNQNVTIELNAIDLHLLDRSIESFNVCDYVRVSSAPHHFEATMLCNKQTMNLLKPENDTVVLGYETATFTGATTQMAASVSTLGKSVSSIKQDASSIALTVEEQGAAIASIQLTADSITTSVQDHEGRISSIEQNPTSITMSVENGEDSSTITLMANGVEIASETIKFTGDVVFASDLANGTTTISGDCITTGSIDAGRITSGRMSSDRIRLTGNMSIYEDADSDTSQGLLGYIEGKDYDGNDTAGVGLRARSSSKRMFIVTDEGVRMSTADGQVVVTENINLETDGNIWFTGTNIYSSTSISNVSDRRKKDAIRYDAEKYLPILDALAPATFLYKEHDCGKRHMGFIAQEVEEAMTAAGIAAEDFALLSKRSDGFYGLCYEEFIPLLVAKIQKLEEEMRTWKN